MNNKEKVAGFIRLLVPAVLGVFELFNYIRDHKKD